MRMLDNHAKLLRALIAAQVAVLEHENEDISKHQAIDVIDATLKEATKLAKKLRQEFH